MARDPYPRTVDVLTADAAIQALVARHGLVPVMQAITIHQRWSEIVGAQIGRVSSPDSLHNGVLSVWVRTSTWMQELRLVRADLLARINGHLGATVVTDLRLHFGAARSAGEGDLLAEYLARRAAGRPRPPRPAQRASPERAAAIAAECAAVEDPELRGLIAGVRTRNDR